MQRQSNIQEVKAMDAFCEVCGSNHDSSEFLGNTSREDIQLLNTIPMGKFPSDTEVAKGLPHEQCKVISTSSGRILNSQNKQGDKIAAHTSSSAVHDKLAEADIPAEADEDHTSPSEPKEVDSAAEAPHIKLPGTDKLKEIRPPTPFP
ncbi:hypothetical protein GQ457_08G031430 [Hibiscus cannabinus]